MSRSLPPEELVHLLAAPGPGAEEVAWSDFSACDPVADTWTRKADVPGPTRYVGMGFAVGEKGYMGLGWSSGHSLSRSFASPIGRPRK